MYNMVLGLCGLIAVGLLIYIAWHAIQVKHLSSADALAALGIVVAIIFGLAAPSLDKTSEPEPADVNPPAGHQPEASSIVRPSATFSATRQIGTNPSPEFPVAESSPQLIATPAPPIGKAVVRDNFTNTSRDWYLWEGADASVSVADGTLRIYIRDRHFLWPSRYLSRKFTDVTVEFDANRAGGAGAYTFGVGCRQSGMGYDASGYMFLVYDNGYFEVWAIESGKPNKKLDFGLGAAVNAGDAPNRLRVDCVGDQLSLYVNGKLVSAVVNDQFKSAGFVEIIGGTRLDPGLDLRFDNLVLYTRDD